MNSTRSYSTLFAGVTGSGKSFTVKRIIETLKRDPETQYIIIDPKRVELMEYARLPQTLYYGDDEDSIYDALMSAYDIMMRRFDDMRENRQTVTDEPHIFIIVDEMAFLMQSDRKKEYVRLFSQVALMGRAAHVHLFLCTQISTQDVIPACIRDNMTNIVCLRQRDAQKYRYLLGSAPGRLPMYGYAYIYTPNMERPEKIKSENVWETLNK